MNCERNTIFPDHSVPRLLEQRLSARGVRVRPHLRTLQQLQGGSKRKSKPVIRLAGGYPDGNYDSEGGFIREKPNAELIDCKGSFKGC